MRPKTMFPLCIINMFSALFSTQTLNASENYAQRANDLRREVWAIDLPSFRNYTKPDSSSDDSWIALASHKQLVATRRDNVIMMNANPEDYSLNNTVRWLVYLNDEYGVEYWSQFDYTQIMKQHNEGGKSVVMGMRIIKNDGSIKEIDVDSNTVRVDYDEKNNVGSYRLSVPGLSVGDIIDYFYSEETSYYSNRVIDDYIDLYAVNLKILNISYEFKIDKRLTFEYRNINGAPDFDFKGEDDKYYILRTAPTVIPLRKDNSSSNSIYPMKAAPMMRYIIRLNKYSGLQPKSARPAGIHHNVDQDLLIEDMKFEMTRGYTEIPVKDVLKYIRMFRKSTPDINRKELAVYIYEYWNYWFNRFCSESDYRDIDYLSALNRILRDNDIDTAIGYTLSKTVNQGEAVSSKDFILFLSANSNSQFFTNNGLYGNGEIPVSEIAGSKAWVFENPTIKSPNGMIKGNFTSITIPETKVYTDTYKLRVAITDDSKVSIERTSGLSNYKKKNAFQGFFFDNGYWDRQKRSYLQIDNSLIEEFEANMKQDHIVRSYVDLQDNQRKRLEEDRLQEVYLYHQKAPEEVKSFEIINSGLNPDSDTLVYKAEYLMDNVLKRAGKDLVLPLGDLLYFMEVDFNDEYDGLAKFRFNKYKTEFNIHIAIPDGYSVAGLDAIRTDFSNKWGGISSEVNVVNNNEVSIVVRSNIENGVIPQDELLIMRQLVDKISDLSKKSIVFERIKAE